MRAGLGIEEKMPAFANKLISTIGSAFAVCALFLTGIGMVDSDDGVFLEDEPEEKPGTSRLYAEML